MSTVNRPTRALQVAFVLLGVAGLAGVACSANPQDSCADVSIEIEPVRFAAGVPLESLVLTATISEDGEPASGADVRFSFGNTLLGTAQADEDGVASLAFGEALADDPFVAVRALDTDSYTAATPPTIFCGEEVTSGFDMEGLPAGVDLH